MNKLVYLILIFFFTQFSFAQPAYDGINNHLFIGYTNVGKTSGIEFQYEGSINEFISMGGRISYLFNPKPDKSLYEFEPTDFEKAHNFINSFNSGIFVRLHIGTFFNSLDERIDPFAGVDLSLKSISGNIGVKYQLTNTIGFYTEYSYSFSNSVYGLDFFKDTDDTESNDFLKDINYFGKRNAFSIGMSLSF